MAVSGTVKRPHELSEAERSALVRLLADEDPAVYRAIREKLIACGPMVTDWLRPHALSSDPYLRRRATEIVTHFERQTADNRFLAFCLRSGTVFDVGEGALLLAKTRYPDISEDGYNALLDSFATDLRQQMDLRGMDRELLEKVNRFFFRRLGFKASPENRPNPENCYLNRVLDRREGDSASLCLVYVLLGKRLRLPVTVIALPGHFLCRYQSTLAEVYIDVSCGGRIMSKADCAHYLRPESPDADGSGGPASPRLSLLRTCQRLHQIYEQANETQEALRLKRYVVALQR